MTKQRVAPTGFLTHLLGCKEVGGAGQCCQLVHGKALFIQAILATLNVFSELLGFADQELAKITLKSRESHKALGWGEESIKSDFFFLFWDTDSTPTTSPLLCLWWKLYHATTLGRKFIECSQVNGNSLLGQKALGFFFSQVSRSHLSKHPVLLHAMFSTSKLKWKA